MSKALNKDTNYKSAKFCVRKQVGVVDGSNKHRTISQEIWDRVLFENKSSGAYFLANNRTLIHILLLWVVLEGRNKKTVLSYGLEDLLDPLISYWFYFCIFWSCRVGGEHPVVLFI